MSDMDDTALTATFDQLGAAYRQQAETVSLYYRTLVEGQVPVDTAAELTLLVGRRLLKAPKL